MCEYKLKSAIPVTQFAVPDGDDLSWTTIEAGALLDGPPMIFESAFPDEPQLVRVRVHGHDYLVWLDRLQDALSDWNERI